jgi:hypothetical protein
MHGGSEARGKVLAAQMVGFCCVLRKTFQDSGVSVHEWTVGIEGIEIIIMKTGTGFLGDESSRHD